MNDRDILDERGVDYDVIELDLARLARGDINAAQSRIDGLDPEQVRVYAECMKNGDVFPEIIVEANKANKFLVLSGNHRVAAAQMIGRASLPALQVHDITDAVRRLIVAGANNKHGKSVTIDDRRLQACGMVEAFGWTHAEAGRAFGLSESQVQNAITMRRGAGRFDRLQAEGSIACKKPGMMTLALITRLRSDKAFCVAAEAAQHCTHEELEAAVTQGNRKNNEDEAVAVFTAILDKARARAVAAGRNTGTKPGPVAIVRKADRDILKLTPEQVRSQPVDEQTETRLILMRLEQHITRLLDGSK